MVRPLISETAVQSIRTLLLRTMPDTCDIYDVAETHDSDGTHSTYTLSHTTVCSFETLTGRELERAQQLAGNAEVLVELPATTPCKTTNRLVVTRAEDGAVFDLQVVYVVEETQEFSKRVYARNLSA